MTLAVKATGRDKALGIEYTNRQLGAFGLEQDEVAASWRKLSLTYKPGCQHFVEITGMKQTFFESYLK